MAHYCRILSGIILLVVVLMWSTFYVFKNKLVDYFFKKKDACRIESIEYDGNGNILVNCEFDKVSGGTNLFKFHIEIQPFSLNIHDDCDRDPYIYDTYDQKKWRVDEDKQIIKYSDEGTNIFKTGLNKFARLLIPNKDHHRQYSVVLNGRNKTGFIRSGTHVLKSFILPTNENEDEKTDFTKFQNRRTQSNTKRILTEEIPLVPVAKEKQIDDNKDDSKEEKSIMPPSEFLSQGTIGNVDNEPFTSSAVTASTFNSLGTISIPQSKEMDDNKDDSKTQQLIPTLLNMDNEFATSVASGDTVSTFSSFGTVTTTQSQKDESEMESRGIQMYPKPDQYGTYRYYQGVYDEEYAQKRDLPIKLKIEIGIHFYDKYSNKDQIQERKSLFETFGKHPHPQIGRFVDRWETKDDLTFVCESAHLKFSLWHETYGGSSVCLVKKHVKQIREGITFLAGEGYYIRQMNFSNLIVDSSGNCKIDIFKGGNPCKRIHPNVNLNGEYANFYRLELEAKKADISFKEIMQCEFFSGHN